MLDFKTLRRSRRPNSYLMAPEGLCEKSRVDKVSPTYPAAPERLLAAYRKVLDGLPRVDILETDPERLGLEAVQRSRLFGFPDLISIQVFDAGEGRSVPAIYSRAKYGRSDFGVNRARVISWIGGVAVALAEINREE
jgi:uncharacterized protein (DUF1499 family)